MRKIVKQEIVIFSLLFVIIPVTYVSAFKYNESRHATTVEESTNTRGGSIPITRDVPKLDASEIERLVNEQRFDNNLQPLAHNELLTQSACAKLDDMTAKDYWGHVSPEGNTPSYWIDREGYMYSHAGENLAYGQTSEDTVVVEWMNSPKHRENILKDFKDEGLCTKTTLFQGELNTVTVQHFGTLR